MGQVPTVPPPVDDEPRPITVARKLREILTTLTAVEEAAIRQIAPLLSIVRLSHGNIASKGNTSCVLQKSKLARVLPNLPEDCKFIVIERQKRNADGTRTGIKSTKFRRDKMVEVLRLLKETGLEEWDIEISEDNISKWPEQGDILNLPGLDISVTEVDEEGNPVEENDENANQEEAVETYCDGDDAGPAPLQNSVIPEETYEAVLNVFDKSTVTTGQTRMIRNAVENAVLHNAAEDDNSQQNEEQDTHPQPRYSRNKKTAKFKQADMFNYDDGFVDMNKTKYAWARAFPTVFIPAYIQTDENTWEWVILHDITGWKTARDKALTFSQWSNYLMWRSDGVPASHPTFALVLRNHKIKCQLQQQGSYVLNTSGIDITTTLQTIREAQADGDNQTVEKQIQEIVKKCHIHSGNIPGTPAYWKSTFHEFKANAFYQEYMLGRNITMFHTGSHAEFHDPFLRRLLSKYVAEISPPGDTFTADILVDDAKFAEAVQKYKNITTHFLESKMEQWNAFFMNPVYGKMSGNLSNEFAKARGGIHYHDASPTSHPAIEASHEHLRVCAEKIADKMAEINNYVRGKYQHGVHCEKHKVPPHEDFSSNGFKNRQEFLTKTLDRDEGKATWEEFLNFRQDALDECAAKIGRDFEKNFGYSAMHTGNFPEDWVTPGGFKPEDDYPATVDGMQSSTDVLERRELKQPKFKREKDLFQRKANITNHAGTHKCSGYCARCENKVQLFDASKPEHGRYDPFESADGKLYVRIPSKNCRMGFGQLLEFENESGENNLTRGKPPIRDKPKIEMDKNGQPKLNPRRNHPRVVATPYGFHFYGANNDTQFILINATSKTTFESRGVGGYEKFANNLVAAGCGGLEHHNGAHIVLQYVTGYCCKGDMNSEEWETSMRSLTEKYCEIEGNEEKTVKSLIAKHMSEISNTMSCPKDEVVYGLAGGLLKRSPGALNLKCSVTAQFVERLGDSNQGTDGDAVNEGGVQPEPNVEEEDNSFTWENISKKYKERPHEDHHLNVYKWVSTGWRKNKTVIPQFFGYNSNASWPMKEDFSKWNLTLFKPWTTSVEELKGEFETFRESLEDYMWNFDEFPGSIRAEILRSKRKEFGVDTSVTGLMGLDADLTPTTGNRTNQDNEEAADQADGYDDNNVPNDEMEEIDDETFRTIDTRIPNGHDWSENFDDTIATKLIEFTKQFYEQQMTEFNENEPVNFFNEELHRPENAKTSGQKFLIYHQLYWQYQMWLYKRGEIHTLPQMQTVYLEGLPGTGKTFVINTIRNIVKSITKSNHADAAVAPTGCAASLIEGSTMARFFSLPVGKKATKAPSNIETTNVNRIKFLTQRLRRVSTLLMDEHSMMGEQVWGWVKHRCEELRRPSPTVTDEEFNEVNDGDQQMDEDIVQLDEEVHNRPYGGIPSVVVCGDSNQLPPVAQRSVYQKGRPKHGADKAGKIAFSSFTNSKDDTKQLSTVVFLDEVLRQSDETFKKLLTDMREGKVDDEDIDLLIRRMLCKMDPDERREFEFSALHLVPTWKQAVGINLKYLKRNLTTPIAKIKADLQSSRTNGKNCCLTESNFPVRNLLCTGATVMLLINFIVEYKIMNGSVGTVKDICFENKEGDAMDDDGSVYVYAVVEFPDSTVPENKAMIPGKPSTWIPIPLVQCRCERKCCSIRTLPLMICKSLSIHKSQGMTVGEGKQFKKVVVHLPTSRRIVPGLELVAISRAVSIQDFAIGNEENEITKQGLKRIGNTPAYKSRKEFLEKLKAGSESSQMVTKEAIKELDDTGNQEKTLEGGMGFLLKWYRETFTANN